MLLRLEIYCPTFMSATAGWPLQTKSAARVEPGWVMERGASAAAEPRVVPGIVTDAVPSSTCSRHAYWNQQPASYVKLHAEKLCRTS